jgi:hypothetical protein
MRKKHICNKKRMYMIEEITTQILPLLRVLIDRYKPRQIVESLLELAFDLHLQYESVPESALNNFKALAERSARVRLSQQR